MNATDWLLVLQTLQQHFKDFKECCMGEYHLKECLIYLDDIIIFSRTLDEHITCLENVFKQLEKHGLKLKASKCEFFKSQSTVFRPYCQ